MTQSGHRVSSKFCTFTFIKFHFYFSFFPLKMGFIIYFLWQWKCSFVTLTSTFQISNWFFTTSLRWKDLYGNTRWVCYKKTDNERKTYALICNQFFDNENKLSIIIQTNISDLYVYNKFMWFCSYWNNGVCFKWMCHFPGEERTLYIYLPY